ncbi:hypothetical protein [Verrucomicrobium sp. GAS474]|uniref:hypothetical protein n=1 Tax=Verrucomicrobium sp. GAS474 TaxID=1882831 RepID=UPI0012FF633F|nr:hypothetical protein [Verrucomicrobium sp. GAS474]
MIIGVPVALMAYLYFVSIPPKEESLIRNFAQHRAEFEQLRGMLQADTHLVRAAGWGVQTVDPLYLGPQSGSSFPVERYDLYLALLKKVDGVGVSRGEGENPDVFILLWATGWAGDTKHVEVSYLSREPADMVERLYVHFRKRLPSEGWKRQYKRIEGNWYLSTDIW